MKARAHFVSINGIKGYVKKTGKCFTCQKRQAQRGDVRCKTCNVKRNTIIKKLRSMTGDGQVMVCKSAPVAEPHTQRV